MLPPTVSNILLVVGSVYTTSVIGGVTAQTEPAASKVTRVPINPCEFSDPDYAFGMTSCVWRELPKSMTSRFSNRFKELVGLDDDGVFDLLCDSIDQKGDILVDAFAHEYVEEREQNLFLETVLKCHDEVLANGNIQPTKQLKYSGRKPRPALRSSSQRKITTDYERTSRKMDIPL